jgi:hypothetical protein
LVFAAISSATSCSRFDDPREGGVLTDAEVNPVLRMLRANGIEVEVEALHNHMPDDEPRLFFMHFWANDDAVKLARGRARRARPDEGPALRGHMRAVGR